MNRYRFYFLREDGAAAANREFLCENDGQANDHAIGLLLGYPYAARVEVWENSRLTLSYDRSTAQTPEELRRLCRLAVGAARRESDAEIRQTITSHALALEEKADALERRASP